MLKLNKIKSGFITMLISLTFSIAAFIMFLSTYQVFRYEINRWTFSCIIIAMWLMIFLLINSLIKGDKPFWTSALNMVIVFLLTYSFLEFINPCLSPIGIYFTVHNMGDTATNAIGVPRSLICAGCYLISIIMSIVSSFLTFSSKKEVE